jgi:lipoprotein-anchoring transpeptidase ErfK/SrfK
MWSRARFLGLLLVFTTALSACDAAEAETAVTSLRPGEPLVLPTVESAVAPDTVPAKPKRQIVDGVEVVVNIPSGRLELVVGDSVVKSYPVSVGSARYATPVGGYLLATVIWNPWWNPPPGSGWARNRKPEPPGPRNPMGRVKLHMDELIYIHGTTSEGRLGAPASHGCIRMSNTDVVDLAKRLHFIAAPNADSAELERLARPGRNERRTVMARSIRMRVTYEVARLRGNRLHVYPNVYGRDIALVAAVKRELARAGMDTAQVPALAWARLRQGAARGGASFALADIPYLVPEPPRPAAETGPALLGAPVAGATAESAPDPAVPQPAAVVDSAVTVLSADDEP